MPLRTRLFLSFVLFLLVSASVLAHPPRPTKAAANQQTRADADFEVQAAHPFTFVAYGDVRFTNPANQNWSNPQFRDALVGKIAEEKPKFVVFVGDLVRKGSDLADWDIMEKETSPLHQAGIPLFPVIGNHETWGDPKAVNYFQHFPRLNSRHWYTVRAANCYFIMLESEPLRPADEQWNWALDRLQNVPADADYVFVVLHHPAMSRSSEETGGHSVRASEQQLAGLIEERQKVLGKPIIVLAGHVHAYERFVHGGVTYITTGGGGASPYVVPRDPNDLYTEPGPTYHFCRFTIDNKSLKFQMVKLTFTPEGHARFNVGDSFKLAAPKRKAVTAASH